MEKIFIALNLFVLLLMPMAAQARFTYTTANGSVTITSYILDPAPTALVPICDDAFENRAVASVIIPDTSERFALMSITIPESITNVDLGAFNDYTNPRMLL